MMGLQHLLDAIRMCDLIDRQWPHVIAHHIAKLLPRLDGKTERIALEIQCAPKRKTTPRPGRLAADTHECSQSGAIASPSLKRLATRLHIGIEDNWTCL